MTVTADPPLRDRKRPRIDRWFLVLPPVMAILVLLVMLPVGWLLVVAFQDDTTGSWTLENFTTVFTQWIYLEPILRSLGVAVSVGALSTVIGGLLAWLATRTNIYGKRLLSILMVATFVTPSFVGAAGWILLSSPNAGLLNRLLDETIGIKPFNVFSTPGVVFVMTLYAIPYTYTLVSATLASMPSSFEDAGRTLGARPMKVLATITLPLAAPALMSGFLLSMLEGLTLFGTPALLAIPAGEHLITTQIYEFFQSYPPSYGLAAAYGLPLIAVMALTIAIQRRVLGRRGFTLVTGKAGSARRVDLGRWRIVLTILGFLPAACAVLLPYGVMLIVSLSPAWGEQFSWSRLTVAAYVNAFKSGSPLYGVLTNTLLYCATSALVAVLLAGTVAYAVARSQSRFVRTIGLVANFPYVVPGIVLAAGFVAAYSSPPFLLYGTAVILVIAFATRFLPLAYQNCISLIKSVDPSLENAARNLGASRLTTLLKITVPLVRRGIFGAWLLAFLAAVRELSTAVFLITPSTEVASTYIFSLANGGRYEDVATVGMITVSATLLIYAVANRLAGSTDVFGKEANK